MEIHDQAAAYALDALDDTEREAFEAHLAGCETCAAEVEEFRETAYLLASAEEGAEPSAALRTRILDAAAREQPRPNVVVLRPRRTLRLVAAVAAAFAAVAIGLGAWAASLSSSLDGERAARATEARAAAILGDGDSRRLPMGPESRVVVSAEGEAVLVVGGVPTAPAGQTYEAWVIGEDGPAPAGLFDGSGRVNVLLLEEPVDTGDVVAVTLEPEGGSESPTGPVLLESEAV
jgi:anti-sigma factor RsiW